jgi:DnaK suppressor protein
MRKRDIESFKRILTDQQQRITGNADRTLRENMVLDTDDLPDEMDLATAEYNQGLVFRLRDRERYLLSKVNKALKKIEKGDFGICEECEEPIALPRLKARPVTTLCIRCKEEQERREKMYV